MQLLHALIFFTGSMAASIPSHDPTSMEAMWIRITSPQATSLDSIQAASLQASSQHD
jgi:hypothetical protein